MKIIIHRSTGFLKSAGLIVLLSLMTISLPSAAQKLDAHRWKNRVLLILSEDDNNPTLNHQLKQLNNNIDGLNERKLVVYQIFPTYSKEGFGDNREIIKHDGSLFRKYNASSDPFKTVLIGLDGGVKFEQHTLLKNTTLFAIIDGMPMRRAELNKKH